MAHFARTCKTIVSPLVSGQLLRFPDATFIGKVEDPFLTSHQELTTRISVPFNQVQVMSHMERIVHYLRSPGFAGSRRHFITQNSNARASTAFVTAPVQRHDYE